MMCNIYNGMSFCVLFLYMYYMYLAYEVIWFYCNSLMLVITCVCWCVKCWYFDTISAVLLCRLRCRPSTPCVDNMGDWLALSLLFLLGKIVTIQLDFISKILCESSEILHSMFSSLRDFKRHILVSWSRLLPFLYARWITRNIGLCIC